MKKSLKWFSFISCLTCLLLLTIVNPASAAEKDLNSPYLISNGTPFLPKNKLADINTYTVYYGAGETNELKKFDLDIIESSNQTDDEINQLKESHSKVISYLSIGEASPQEWYFPMVKKSWQLGENTTWGSMYIDVRNQGWHNLLLNTVIPKMQEKGIQGLFLDTVDTVDIDPGMADAMVQLIKEIREKYPNFILVMNRGFTVMDQAIPYIDGIMFESFTSHIDWTTGNYVSWEGNDKLWTTDIAERLGDWQKRTGLTVLALDYADPSDTQLKNEDYNRATSNGENLWDFVPYVSTIDLQHIYDAPKNYSRNNLFRDSDGDGVVNAEEIKYGLNPYNPDTLNNSKGDLYTYNALSIKQWAMNEESQNLSKAADSKLKNIMERMSSIITKPNEGMLQSTSSLLNDFSKETNIPITDIQSHINDIEYLINK